MPSGFSNNRLKNKAYLLDKGSEAFLKTANTKTVPDSRIRRCLINLLMGYSKEDMVFFKEEYPSYVRLLAAGEKGRVILREINESGKSVITKLSDFISSKRSFETADMKSIMFDMKADDLYYLNQNITGADLKYTPYIEKKIIKNKTCSYILSESRDGRIVYGECDQRSEFERIFCGAFGFAAFGTCAFQGV